MKPKYFLMRHGDAGARLSDPTADSQRELTPAGEQRVAKNVRQLMQDGKQPTALYCDNTSVRCVQTAAIAGKMLGLTTQPEPRLAEPETARQAILDASGHAERPMLVTHDHVIGTLEGDLAQDDWPKKGEIRQYKGTKEKNRWC